MKLLRPLAGHTFNDHKTNDSIHRELQTECILDEMNTEGTGFYTCKECHTTESLSKHTTIIHKERKQSGDRRNVGESSYNSGDRTGQMAQPLMFIIMMMMTLIFVAAIIYL